MQKIVPHLWFDTQAKEAALFYVNLFENAQLQNTTVIGDTPSGDTEIVHFQLAGQLFSAISAGPYFQLNPSISLMVSCKSKEEVDHLWSSFAVDGDIMMPLEAYDFSPYYGWVQDRFGLSWQLMLDEAGDTAQKITPCLLFSDTVCGKAEEACRYYTEVFNHAEISLVSRYKDGEAKNPKAQVNYVGFTLEGMGFSAMDNAYPAAFKFNEAFSFMVNCKDQAEIDYFWSKLSFDPASEQCGWVKDQFGLSWQIVPDNLEAMLLSGTPEEVQRITEAFLKMKKFDLALLEKARLGI